MKSFLSLFLFLSSLVHSQETLEVDLHRGGRVQIVAKILKSADEESYKEIMKVLESYSKQPKKEDDSKPWLSFKFGENEGVSMPLEFVVEQPLLFELLMDFSLKSPTKKNLEKRDRLTVIFEGAQGANQSQRLERKIIDSVSLKFIQKIGEKTMESSEYWAEQWEKYSKRGLTISRETPKIRGVVKNIDTGEIVFEFDEKYAVFDSYLFEVELDKDDAAKFKQFCFLILQ